MVKNPLAKAGIAGDTGLIPGWGKSPGHLVVSGSSQPHELYSSPASPVYGILQTRTLEWVAIPFFRDLPNPGIKPGSPALQADSLPSEP